MPNRKLARGHRASDAELERQATPDDGADAEAAVAFWNRYCTPAFRGLLEAQTDTRAAERIDRKLEAP